MISTNGIQIILEKLESDGLKVKETGNSQWKAQCPAHDDQKSSLSIKEADDGTILLKCFAGCEARKICDALGIPMSELFPNKAAAPVRGNADFSESNIEATYDYRDKDGEMLVLAGSTRTRATK